MSSEQIKLQLHVIRQHLVALSQGDDEAGTAVDTAIDALDVLYEEMQTSLEIAELVMEELLHQTQNLTEHYHHYYDLFRAAPLPYLITDAAGVILEANQAAAWLLNVPHRYLPGKPLAAFIAPDDCPAFRTQLNQLAQTSSPHTWRNQICPREGEAIAAELRVAVIQNLDGGVESLRIGLYVLSADQPQSISESSGNQGEPVEERMHQVAEDASEAAVPHAIAPQAASPLPESLDGLQVLVVDDEADAREFITAVLESHGVRVMAVSTAAAALEALEQFHPDVLVSDIRMPNSDGYRLIQQIRALEAQRGGHLPAAAITAYLEEDREKALTAGFEAHLHKLARPNELVGMVAQLARRAAPPDRSNSSGYINE